MPETRPTVDFAQVYRDFKANPWSIEAAWQRVECGEALWPGDMDKVIVEFRAMKAVVDAARTLRRIAGFANKHRANCEAPACETCRVLRDMEADAALDLDMQLAQLAAAHA